MDLFHKKIMHIHLTFAFFYYLARLPLLNITQ